MPKARGDANRTYWIVLTLLWVVAAIGAVVYARMKSIPALVAAPIGAAFLFEVPFYLLPGFSAARKSLRAKGAAAFASAIALASVAPWLIYSIPSGLFAWGPFVILLAIATAVSFWYVLVPVGAWRDAVFVAGLAAIIAGHLFDSIYLSPIPKVPLSILGHAMLIRTGALSILELRGDTTAEFRFWPDRSEWLVGLCFFAALLPFTAAVYWALGLVQLREHPYSVLQSAGTFFGILWFTALSEEFFFRGLLQQWFERWTSSAAAALAITSLLFGSVHLDMHHQFPNWRFAIVAAVAGCFYGLAFRKNRSVQASMVAHALTVTVWKTFLR